MSKGGRKGKYDPETMPQKAEEYAKAGYLDKQIAEIFGVRPECISVWQRKYPQFSQALKRGREVANIELKQAMLKTAAGYDVTEEETTVFLDKNKQPKGYKKVSRKRHIPPSTTMQIFLAKNRMPEEFQDVNRHEIDVRGKLRVNTLADLMLEEYMNDEENENLESTRESDPDQEQIPKETERP